MSGQSAVTAMETAEINLNVDINNPESTDIQSQISVALQSCVTYLRDKTDSFTFESVRRMLEESIGLEKYALDVHKSFVEEHLIKCLEDTGSEAASVNAQENGRPVEEVVAKPSEEHRAKNDAREETGGEDEEVKGSSENISKTVAEDTNEEGNREEALMSDIKRALRQRASYIKDSAETLTLFSLRRVLEQDLNLERESLDPFKKFISKGLDEVLQIPDAPKRSRKDKSTPSKELGSDANSESDAEDDMDDDDEELAVEKTKTRKRKCENGKSVSEKKKAKRTETDSENDSDAGDDNEMMEANGHSQKPLKIFGQQIKVAATTTPVYGKRVEYPKSVIKSCGMSVPPVIYRKVKQAPEEIREATLIEELEQILAREGLSSDPSEKALLLTEIKGVKKKKDIAKELEGIDTSNIVSSLRRRSTTSFVPPPMPIMISESESDEPDESENGEERE